MSTENAKDSDLPVRQLWGECVSGAATAFGTATVSELEEHLAPIFSEMSLDRLHRAAYDKDFKFAGRPRGASPDSIQAVARAHLKRRQDEEAEHRTTEREARAWRKNAAIALLSAAVGAGITAFFC